jgi:hypothetical protein
MARDRGRNALHFVAHAALFVTALQLLSLVNQASRTALGPWWLVPAALAGGLGASLLTHRPGPLARVACLALIALALAPLAHCTFGWIVWLAIGGLVELVIGAHR